MKNYYVKGILSYAFLLAFLLNANFQLKAEAPIYSEDGFCFDANLPDEEVVAFMAQCVTAPVLICPSIHEACPGTPTHPNTAGYPQSGPGDPNCVNPTVTYSDNIIQNQSCDMVIHRLWLAEYDDPNTNQWLYSECTQIILLVDDTPPAIANCPGDIALALDSNCDAIANWTPPTATDDCGLQSITSNYNPGHNFPVGTTAVIYTAVDNCGNTSHCTFNVTVTGTCCQDVPSITCPSSVSGCVGMDISPATTGYPTSSMATPGCPAATLTYVDNVSQIGNCSAAVQITRVWTATNPATPGLTASCNQIITVNDITAPAITGCPGDIVIEVAPGTTSATANWSAPNATDNCNLASFISNYNPGSSFNVGTTTVTYTATDDCSNVAVCDFNVSVVVVGCATPPTITCPPNVVNCVGSDYSPNKTGFATATAGGANCDPPIVSFKDHFLVVGPCPGRLFIRRIWTAMDPSDTTLVSTCIQTINHRDSDAPVFSNCPSDINIMVTGSPGCSAGVTWTAPTISDNCSTPTLTSTHTSGNSFPEGTTTVTYTATDDCGNTSTCSFNVTVTCLGCQAAPFINCPPMHVACVGSDTSPATTGTATATAGSVFCGTPIVSYSDYYHIVGPCQGRVIIHRTWTATDPNDASLSTSCVQRINLRDSDAPLINGCPSDITLQIDGDNCSAPVSWNAPTAVDNCGLQSITSTHNSGDVFAEGVTTVTYTATDNCGNASTCSFNVTIECLGCTVPPVINCPANYVGCPGDDYSPAALGYAVAMSGSGTCQAPILTYYDDIISTGPCSGAIEIDRIWLATDPHKPKLFTGCIQLIRLQDSNVPDIANCPADITLQSTNAGCTAIASWNQPSATDDCGLDTFISSHQSGTAFNQGTTTVSYTATDNCGNVSTCSFNVTVECQACATPPVITCPADGSTCPGGDTSPSSFGTATAVSGGPLCSTPVITHTDFVIGTGSCYVIERTWTATDPSNTALSSTCVQTIEIEDDIAPMIVGCPGDIVNNNPGSAVNWTVPTYTDNCNIASWVCSHNPGQIFPVGTTTVTCTATDDCGNTTDCSFDVTVVVPGCSVAPIITCPADVVLCPGDHYGPTSTGFATAVAGGQNCDAPIVTSNDVIISNGPCTGALVVERTWTAADPTNGALNSTCVQMITLSDNVAPVISNCPANISVSGNGNNCSVPVTWTAPSYTDNCQTGSITSNYASGASFNEGTTTVTYTATDACGNVAQCSFTVTVTCAGCTTPPTIYCPADVQLCPGSNYNPNNTGHATATSNANCGAPLITFSDLVVSTGPCSTSKVIERTWTATDPNNSNLSSTCVQTISLTDNTAPVITGCPANITVSGSGNNCSVPVTWTAPNYTDNCHAISLTSNYASGASFNEGTTTVTYTATDACGNVSHCSFNVTVVCAGCATPPTITCPADATVCPASTNWGPGALGYATATSGGAHCGAPIITHNDVIVSTGNCQYEKTVERTWTATDPNNGSLKASCVQTIYKVDNTAPVITGCPADLHVTGSGANCSATVNWTAPTYTDNCQVQSLTSNYASGSVFTQGTTTVIYTATDACGNVSHCSFDVVVTCSAVDCPDDIVVTCNGSNGTPVTWSPPVYNGSCGDCTPGAHIPGFIYMGEYNGHQYYCSLNPATYATAAAVCASNGGYLASIGGAGENNFLANILTIQSAWIGCNDAAQEGTYVWDSGEPFSYTNWYPGQPNNVNNQDYVEMLSNGEWNDQYGYQSNEFIMELPCNSVTQVAGPAPGDHLQAGTYTVTYHVQDNCGYSAYCSFTITVESGISLTCVDDAVLTCPANQTGMYVNWDQPLANSCCSANCQGGQSIPGFIYMGEYNGHHYYCSVNPATWAQAQANCSANGGYLACVGDAGENNYLANLLVNQSAWIGLTGSPGNYAWDCGEPFNYNNWYPGQPNNYGGIQDCVEMLSNGQWNDEYPTELNEYIMEIPGCISIVQTAGPTSGSFFQTGTTTTISYQATDACGNVATCSFTVTIDPSVCNSGGNSKLSWINKVHFGNMTNISGNNGGYASFLNHCMDIQPHSTYSLYLEPGFGSAIKDVYWKVWVDFNMDGDYTDAGEYIAFGNGSTALSGNITMPKQLWNGTTTMRIAMKCGSYPTGPCEVFAYGETEDYCVNITGGEFHQGGSTVGSRSSDIDQDNATQIFGDVIEDELEKDIRVFPNPATDFVNVDITNNEAIIAIELFDMKGGFVRSIGTEDYNRIDVSDLDGGAYLINVLFNDGDQLTKRIIVID